MNGFEKPLFLLLAFFPISLIVGNLFINLTFFIIALIFIIDLLVNKNLSFLKDMVFWIPGIFFFTLLINVLFSMDPSNSLPRVLKVLLMIPFVIQVKMLFCKYPTQIEKIVFGFWSFILFIVFLDVVFEIIFGFNTLGFRSPITMPSRIASFFGDELVVGSFFSLFSVIFVTYFLKFYGHLLKTNTLIIFILIVTSFLIGERSNFIKYFISISFIYFFILQINLKKKIFVSVLLFIFLSLLITFNSGAKYRYYDQLKSIYSKNGITNYLKKSKYGAHYDTAFKIFKNYPLFRIGIKNFRVESGTAKYRDGSYKSLDGSNYSLRWATHPHQTHFELLSETGIFGYLCFLLFIITSLFFSLKNYFKNKNLFQLASVIYIVVFLIPLFPSGSFFSTFTSSLFWINYAIMMSYNKKTIN